MSGISRIINGELAQSKSKGKKFKKEVASKMSPKAIASKKC